MEQVVGTVEHIVFQNGDTGYTVAHLQEVGKKDTTCIVGVMPALQPGETVRCQGKWKRHLVHGNQFEVDNVKVEKPADVVGITKYLGSGLVKGIGPAFAKRIVDVFGENTLNIIDMSPERLLDVAGIGKKRKDLIAQCWEEQKAVRDVMVFLQGHGVSSAFAQKIFKCYGSASIQKVKENPYGLARDVFGMGFKTADKIAAELGIKHDAPQRIDAGIEFVLSELSDDGHVCYPLGLFLETAQETLGVPLDNIRERIPVLTNGDRIVVSENVGTPSIWLKPLSVAEAGIGIELERLVLSPCRLRTVDSTKAVAWVEEVLHIHLADRQRTAVAAAVTDKVHIITGGPGTGKSTITKAILAITNKLTDRIVLAAPTGRAAKRMAEITKSRASTIHSLLEYDFRIGTFKKNRKDPIDADLVVIDEASMIDTLLMYHLLKAIPSSARVVFVGDINQLPSVGPGNVLKDMILSERLGVTTLNKIYRQARLSRIVMNAHSINDGYIPDLSNDAHSDFFFLEEEDPEAALKTIVDLVAHRLPRKYHLNPVEDIQVLAPMKRGIIGTYNLNTVLQERLNPGGKALFWYGQHFREGDKVMQIRNNYHKEVFNGDVGIIEHIDAVLQTVKIGFDGKTVLYDFRDLDEVVLAYAVSVHKYQGSECPCVIIPVHTTHFKLLHRNLLYTAVTRGKRLVVLVGTKKALAIAVKNDEVQRRYTGLTNVLKSRLTTGLGDGYPRDKNDPNDINDLRRGRAKDT